MKTISLLIVDDHTVVREGLRALLKGHSDIRVTGEAENGRQAITVAEQTQPDVVLMDLAMPQLNGYEATRQIRKRVPSAKVLVLSSYSDEQAIAQVTQAGAAGMIPKQAAASELICAICHVQSGRHFFSTAPGQPRSKPTGLHGSELRVADRLSSREIEVLQLVAEGLPNKLIAPELGISIKTVEKHRQSLMDKLHLHDVPALTRYASSRGFIERSSRLDLGAGNQLGERRELSSP